MMTPEEAIDVLQEKISPCVAGKWKEAVDMAISALQAQDSKTRKICNTCKHDPPKMDKWPCIDCDMREPADRWEPKDIPGTNVGSMISRQAAIEWCLEGLNNMPSAQLEIIRCKDCTYGVQDEYGRWYCRSLGCQIGDEDGNGFCSDAERRTDE